MAWGCTNARLRVQGSHVGAHPLPRRLYESNARKFTRAQDFYRAETFTKRWHLHANTIVFSLSFLYLYFYFSDLQTRYPSPSCAHFWLVFKTLVCKTLKYSLFLVPGCSGRSFRRQLEKISPLGCFVYTH